MAYADQQMSGNRITALIIVALIHVFVGYALVTGLAYSAVQQVIKKVTTVDIKQEEKKPPPPPPPPPKAAPPPPIVAPPPKINIAPAPPVIQTVVTPPPPQIVLAPPPVVAPPAPKFTPKAAMPKGNPGMWVTTDDYPSRALRENRSGTTAFRVSVGTDGRVSGCEVTSSSGNDDLDQATCTYFTRRARFTPAMDGDGKPTTGSFSSRVKWVIPKD